LDEARQGDYALNPFEFRRHWIVEDKSGSELTRQQEPSREDILEREVRLLRQLIESRFASDDQTNDDAENAPLKAKKSLKGKTPTTPSLLKRLRSSFGDFNQAEDTASEASSSAQSERPPPYSDDPPAPVKKFKTIYIKKVELLLNGSPIDQECSFSCFLHCIGYQKPILLLGWRLCPRPSNLKKTGI